MVEQDRGGCFRNCAIGCLVVGLLGILLIVGGAWLTTRPFKKAIAAREELDRKFGEPEEWQPAADGVIAAGRIDAFVSVREAMMPLCEEFAALGEQFARMDAMEESEVSSTEALREGLRTARMATGIGRTLGRHIKARNDALLAAEMGLGEYSWLYLVAYGGGRLGSEFPEAGPFGEDAVSDAARQLLVQQIETMRAELGDGVDGFDAVDWAAELEAEIGRLQEDPERMPWQEGLPAQLSGQLVENQVRLDELFCPETRSLDLARGRSDGISIQIE